MISLIIIMASIMLVQSKFSDLDIAIMIGQLENVKPLLESRQVDPGANDNRAIKIASELDLLEVVKLLLQDERVDPSAEDNFAIKIALQNGHTEVVKELISRIDISKITDDKILEIAKSIKSTVTIKD